jgi:hypothetical protein
MLLSASENAALDYPVAPRPAPPIQQATATIRVVIIKLFSLSVGLMRGNNTSLLKQIQEGR